MNTAMLKRFLNFLRHNPPIAEAIGEALTARLRPEIEKTMRSAELSPLAKAMISNLEHQLAAIAADVADIKAADQQRALLHQRNAGYRNGHLVENAT